MIDDKVNKQVSERSRFLMAIVGVMGATVLVGLVIYGISGNEEWTTNITIVFMLLAGWVVRKIFGQN